MSAPVVWFEIAGRDLPGLTKFYGDLFGWKINADNPMNYGMVDTGTATGIPGGIFADANGAGDYVSVYVEVGDLAAALTRAEELGATVVQPLTKVPDGPTVAMVTDPEGHRIGLIQGA
jgi:predicted enzyme related to lactoylglutathione lyase